MTTEIESYEHSSTEESKFATGVQRRRDFIENMVIVTSLAFLINVLISYCILQHYLSKLGETTFKPFAILYAWNVIFTAGIVRMFNKYKY
jgi:hypothetical protein